MMGPKASLLILCLWGGTAGLSSIPFSGAPLFYAIGLFGFLRSFENEASSRMSALKMGAFVFGYLLAALHWIPLSLHVDWGHYFYLVPLALVGLPALFAFYAMVGSFCFPWYYVQGIMRLTGLAFFWLGFEVVRAEFLTGFPWASLGYIWSSCLPIAQMGAYMGPYGLGFFSVLWLSVPYVMCCPYIPSRQKSGYVILMLLTFGGMYGMGYLRMQRAVFEPTPPIALRMVQPNFPQETHWTEKKMIRTLETFAFLSNLESMHAVKAVLWPEFSMPLAVQRWPWMRPYIQSATPKGGVLITNGFRYAHMSKGYCVHSSILIFDDQGHGVDFYDKHLLLPFGEYIPLRFVVDRVFPGMVHKMSAGMGDFAHGPGPKTCCVEPLSPFIPMLCHEVIFSGKFHGEKTRHAKWILNLTNDGWFLHSLEPYQHLEMARMRAIEFGLPLVRVANNGISAVIDALGRTVFSLPYGRATTLDFLLPAPLKEQTVYGKLMRHNPYPWVCWILLALMGLRVLALGWRRWGKK